MAIAALLLAAAPGLSAQDYPPVPDGPVYDGADILAPSTVSALDTALRDYNRETGRAIVVATVPDLGGQSIESYATTLFSDEWGIGGEQRDAGLLLLIARDDRKMRIEVGYGLHGYFGGIMAGRVINDVITPQFKAGNFDAGVVEGVDAILEHLAKSPEDAVAIAEAAETAEQQRSRSEGGFPFGFLIWIGFMFFFFVLPIIRGSRRKRKYRSKGKGPWGKRRDDDDYDDDGFGSAVGNIILWEIGTAIARGAMSGGSGGGSSGWGGGGGGGGFGGFGGGMSGGGGASGGW